MTIGHELVKANGLRFHVATCGEGERLALCLHGFPECWYSWRHQLPMLAARGFRAWAPDLRGYGESDKPPRVADYAIEHLMGDVAGLIDAADAKEVTLVGHDWGGIIAWYFALRRVRPLTRLVLLNIPHPGASAAAFRRWKQLRKSWYVLFFQIPWLPERLLAAGRFQRMAEAARANACHPENISDEDVAVYREALSRPGAIKAMLDYYRALLRGGGRRQAALGFPVIDVPTLMLWGVNDLALTIETTHGTEAYVSDLTLRYLSDASHWVQQDAPDTVNSMLEAWLEGRTVPEASEAT